MGRAFAEGEARQHLPLALVLVYEHWRAGGRPFALSNVFAHAEGLSRRAGTAGQSRLFNDYSITITCPSASTSPGSARKEPREHITTTASPLLLAPPEDEGHHRHLIYLKAAFLKRAH